MSTMTFSALAKAAAPSRSMKQESPAVDSKAPNLLSRYYIKPKGGGRASIEVARVQSSNVSILAYNHADSTLTTTFTSGAVYQYFQVPRAVFEACKTASSVGRFHYYGIRKRYYYKRIG